MNCTFCDKKAEWDDWADLNPKADVYCQEHWEAHCANEWWKMLPVWEKQGLA